jgi:hypothetical protein
MLSRQAPVSGSPPFDPDGKSPEEKILGEIAVVAKLAMGAERLRLIFTNERILIARVGKRTGSAAPFTSIFGVLAAGLEDLFKGGRESLRKRASRDATPLQLLESDPDNLSVRYSEVVMMEVREDDLTRITLVSKDEKLELVSGASAKRLKDILGNLLGEKLSISRVGPAETRRR